MKIKNTGFTLVEVLIVISIIGIVASITIPQLITKINDQVNKHQKEVIEDRLLAGFNQLNTLSDGFNSSQYTNSEDFVKELSKHYKITAICSYENLSKCFPYENMEYINEKGTKQLLKIANIKNAMLGLNPSEFFDLSGFINAQGNSFLIALKRDCSKDTEKAMQNLPLDCIALTYDKNGVKGPNRFGSDIVAYEMKPSKVLDIIGGIKILTQPKIYDPIKTADYCDINENSKTVKSEYSKFIKECSTWPDALNDTAGVGDYWAAAAIACYKEGGRLPDEVELAKIADAIYTYSDPDFTTPPYGGTVYGTLNTDKISNSPLAGISGTSLWSSAQHGGGNRINGRYFANGYNYRDGLIPRTSSTRKTLCITD